MKHTIKLLTLAAILTAVFGLTGCPGPVNNYIEPVHEHVFGDWSDWEVVTTATCTEDGSKKRTRTCSCGEVEEETAVIAALGHNWVLESDTATCTTEGVKTYKCSRCNETRTEDSPALGHNFEGGYCERCRVYEFENNQYTVKVFTSREKFLNVALYQEESEDSTNVYYSFEEEPNISVNELLSLKSRFRGRNIIMAYDFVECYGDWGENLPPSGNECWSLDEKGFMIGCNPIVLISN